MTRTNTNTSTRAFPSIEEVANIDRGRAMEQLLFPELVDIETVARLLGVGERYVRRMVANREIEVVKVGHCVRFDLDVVRHWVENRRRPPAEGKPA